MMDNSPGQGALVVKGQEDIVVSEQQELAVTSSTLVLENVYISSGKKRIAFSVATMALDRARTLLSVLVASLFILTFILQPFRIPSESMERTLLVGDLLLVNKVVFSPAGIWSWLLPYRPPHRGDILVFRFPLDGDDHVVKRIIGIGGDAVHLKNGVVYRNGEALDERYTRQLVTWPLARTDSFRDNFPNAIYTDPGVDAHWWFEMQRDRIRDNLIVPSRDYFVLGDNRNYSRDSRYWGFVPRQNIVGMPMIIYFSVREPSRTDPAPPAAQDDRLGDSVEGGILGFARWDRILRVVR
jgi:signal peptidase I